VHHPAGYILMKQPSECGDANNGRRDSLHA
jgi:hypothetical protein